MGGKKDKSNGADPSGLRAAGAKTTADDKAKKSKAVQTRLDLGDQREEMQEIELRVPISDDEAALLDRRATQALGEADEETARLTAYCAPIKAKIAELRKSASTDAADSKARSRAIVQRTRVVYRPSTATVSFLHPDTGREVMLSRAMTAAEMARFDDEDDEAVALPPEDAEAMPEDQP